MKMIENVILLETLRHNCVPFFKVSPSPFFQGPGVRIVLHDDIAPLKVKTPWW